MSIAKLVRERNDDLWLADADESAAPELLIGEPMLVDQFETPDGRSWIRVYLDGSALDQNGIVHKRAPYAASERRIDAHEPLAA